MMRLAVFLADRDNDARRTFGEYLRRFEVDLEEATDGREALAKALARPHDAVVTETRLPGLSGIELCQLLRRDLATKDTPIIVVTADIQPTTVERARKAGADIVLHKPCLPAVLLAETQALIHRSGGLRQRVQELRTRVTHELARSKELNERARIDIHRTLSRSFKREETSTPPDPPPALRCPACDQLLIYQYSHVGGVSERHREQWDYFECARGCGRFQYRQRTRKIRHV